MDFHYFRHNHTTIGETSTYEKEKTTLFFLDLAKRVLIAISTIVLIFITSSNAEANQQSYAIDYLYGEGDLSGVRLGYRPYHTELVEIKWLGKVNLYWELSINFWEFGADNKHQTNYAIALSPVISKQFALIDGRYPIKWEFGIGVSLIEDTQFAGKDIGSHYQFEDRLGLVMEFGEGLNQSFSVRYMHYSNGGLNSKNPGMDFLNLSYSKQF